MGDRRRFLIFADWLLRQFPRAHRILDVAGGHGGLAVWLEARGKEVTILDPRAKTPRRTRVRCLKMYARDYHAEEGEWDAVVGLHPDSATLDVVRIAAESRCPFAIVPCCHLLPDGTGFGGGARAWVARIEEYATHLRFETWCGILDMHGKNLVIKGWPCKL